jgi:hypothetical protein
MASAIETPMASAMHASILSLLAVLRMRSPISVSATTAASAWERAVGSPPWRSRPWTSPDRDVGRRGGVTVGAVKAWLRRAREAGIED